METKEYRTTDKTTWGSGPWSDEPDKRQWIDQATGLPCLIVRVDGMGHLCGYVGVPPSHPAHGKSYSNWDYSDGRKEVPWSDVESAINAISVHGGLSYANRCAHGEDESRAICHVPGIGEPDDVWWFGFDCAHSGDLSPAEDYKGRFACQEVYRMADYVEAECRDLARQLAAIQAGC